MQKETMTAAEIEAAIRGMVRQTECTITIADDPTGWHATVGGWGTTAATASPKSTWLGELTCKTVRGHWSWDSSFHAGRCC